MNSIRELICKKLPGQRFGVFFSTGEGSFFPDGTEESSGYVVAEDGTHWFYWTDWMDGREIINDWQNVRYDPQWATSSEYANAALAAARPAEEAARDE